MTDKAIKPREAHSAAKQAPFLVWPVARREVYLAICISMVPTLAWGAAVFGWRAVANVLAAVIGALLMYFILRRFTYRGKRLLEAHTLGAALLLACLSAPMWPAWLMLVSGAVMTLLIFACGGPGRERIGSAMFVAVALLLLAPRLMNHPQAEYGEPLSGDRILARNRLFMGDLDATAAPPHTTARWPRSRELGGNDPVMAYRPVMVANEGLDAVSYVAASPAAQKGKAAWKERVAAELSDSGVGLTVRGALKLPALEWMFMGMAPGAMGCVSGLAILLAGAYLAYRNILRPQSCFVFLTAFLVGLVLTAVSFDAIGQIGVSGVFRAWRAAPDQMITLLAYGFFGSDALFASVFLLAWPGTEPITPRGRLVFLIVAGLLAAVLTRYALPLPAATLTLTAMQQLTGVFDRMFRHWSWLNR